MSPFEDQYGTTRAAPPDSRAPLLVSPPGAQSSLSSAAASSEVLCPERFRAFRLASLRESLRGESGTGVRRMRKLPGSPRLFCTRIAREDKGSVRVVQWELGEHKRCAGC